MIPQNAEARVSCPIPGTKLFLLSSRFLNLFSVKKRFSHMDFVNIDYNHWFFDATQVEKTKTGNTYRNIRLASKVVILGQ